MKKRFIHCIYYAAFAGLLGSSACNKMASSDMPSPAVSLYQVVKEDSYNFSTFRSLIDRAGLSDLYQQAGEYTVFAPNNSAFTAAGYTTAVIQATSTDSLQRLVKNHIVQGKIDIRAISGTQELTALSGEKISVQKIGNAIYVDGSDITNPQTITATNGTLNVINKLLVKKASVLERINTYVNATSNSTLTFCAAAIARASEGSTNLVQLLSDPKGEYTFFAPNNGAFIDAGFNTLAKITSFDPDSLTRLLQYQLLPGRKLVSDLDSLPVNSGAGVPVYFDRAKPTITTFGYANGIVFGGGGSSNMLAGKSVVHTVSRIFPKPIATTTLARIRADTTLTFFDAALLKASPGGDMDYVKILYDPKAADTVYAITNQAFRNAGYATITAVNNESVTLLGKILKFHLLPKRQNSLNFPENGTAATLLMTKTSSDADGPTYLTITRTGGYKVKGPSNPSSATVSPADIVTTNGLLNVINLVLQP
jgi:uncharacterized surface protein with fasciclin (FAS1) repeats